MAPLVGIALETSVVRAAYRKGGRMTFVEHAWDALAPERAVDVLRAEIGAASSIVLSVGLGFLEIAKPELPVMDAEDRRRVLLRDADRYFPLEGALAIASPVVDGDSPSLAFATTSEQLQRWVRAFEEWAPVNCVIASPEAIANVISAAGSFLIDAGSDEIGFLTLHDGQVREVRRLPMRTADADNKAATSLLGPGTESAPGKYSAALGALSLVHAPLSVMLLDGPMETLLRSARTRRRWLSYGFAALSLLAVGIATEQSARNNIARHATIR